MESGVDVSSVFPEEMSKDVGIETSTAEEAASKESMEMFVHMLVEVADKREGDAHNHSDEETDVVPDLVSSGIVQVLIGSSDVDLHTSESEDGGQDTPDSVVEGQANNIADHWELLLLPVALNCLLLTGQVKHC